MKVVVDARSIVTSHDEVLPQGGVGRYLHQLLLQYGELAPDMELTLIVRPANRRPILDRAGVREVPSRYRSNTWRGLFGMARALDLRGADLYHAPHNVLPFAIGCPAVTTVHDVMWLTHPELCAHHRLRRLGTETFYRTGIGRALRRSAHVLTVSETARREIERIAPQTVGRVTAIHHGVEPDFGDLPQDRVRAALSALMPPGTPPDMPYVLVVGQGSPYKNHARAIRAFLQAFADRREVRLVLARRMIRPDGEVSRLLADPAIAERVIVLARVTETQLRALYCGARALFFPSLMEGFGMPPLEAMACGTPVIASDRGAMLEVSGPAALHVDPTSVDDMAGALRRLIDDQALRATLIAAGRERVGAFAWRRCAEATLAVYRQVAEGGGGWRSRSPGSAISA